MVLKWFYSLSRRKTFVGGKCALPSALLVTDMIIIDFKNFNNVNLYNCFSAFLSFCILFGENVLCI